MVSSKYPIFLKKYPKIGPGRVGAYFIDNWLRNKKKKSKIFLKLGANFKLKKSLKKITYGLGS